MAAILSAGIASGLAGAGLGSYLGPMGIGFGAAIGFCCGCLGYGILSSLLMAGAFRVAVVSALDPNYEKTLSEENGKSS